jgi:monovalent cation:H+ antiporter-2, CPA2 family
LSNFLLLTFIFLVAGVITVPIASKFKLGSVLGYLLAGIAISPILAGLQVDVESLQHFAEFGVVMMLFLVGLELNPKMIWEMRNRLLGLGGLQVILTAAAVALVAIWLNQPVRVAIAIGLIFALSSTAIVLQTLNERSLMRSDGGKASFSILLFQDIAVIPILALLPLLAVPELAGVLEATLSEQAGTSLNDADHETLNLNLVEGMPGWMVMLSTIGAIGIVILGGFVTVRPLFRYINMANLRELFTAAALMIVIGIALLMSIVGLSPALGAFIGGVVLANSEYRHELEADIDPFRGLLLGLFFMTVGASINFEYLFNNFATVIAFTAGLIMLKILIIMVISFKFNLTGQDRWLTALGLAQAGEFGFVLISYSLELSVLPESMADQLLLVVALSMLLTPVLFLIYDFIIVPRYIKKNQREADEIDVKSKIIIAGHGRVGSVVNRILTAKGHETTVIDFSSEHLETLRTFGFRVYFGDATRPDLLEAAGIGEAEVLIIAIDDKEKITKLSAHVLKHYPHVSIITRAIERYHVYDLWFEGCREIVRDTFDSSLRMGRIALETLGLTREEADGFVDDFRVSDQQLMIELADLYDANTPIHQNEAFVEKAKALMADFDKQMQSKHQH